jgi:hypothetical protein
MTLNNLDYLLQQVRRPCTQLECSRLFPTAHSIEQSWLGRVTHRLPDENIPLDKHGNEMMELGQFFLPALPYVPSPLSGVILLTAFISCELEGDSGDMEGCFEIREYRNIEQLITKESESLGLRPFPADPKLAESDYPVWDGGGLTVVQEDAFLALERSGVISNYYDVTSHLYGHKFGGYPSFCQSGVDLQPHEFIFQVSSDDKLGLNVIDNGSLTFWRHPELKSWRLYYDSY